MIGLAAAAMGSGLLTGLSSAGSFLSSAKGLFGGGDGNKDARRMFQYQRHFAIEDMVNADRRKVQSLKNAGLNPALAYGGFGGPSTGLPQEPSANYAPDYENNRINSAREGMLAMAQIGKLQADTAASESVADLNKATAIRTAMQTQVDANNAGLGSLELDKAKLLRQKNLDVYAAAEKLDAEHSEAFLRKMYAEDENNARAHLNKLAEDYGYHNFKYAVSKIDFRKHMQELLLQQYSMPKASAEHDFYLTTFGKSIAPYLNSAESISRTVRPFSRR